MSYSRSKKRLPLMLGAIAVLMFGFGYALVPLYDIFCEAVGIRLGEGGTGRVEAAALGPVQVQDRWVKVHFDANTSGLPWDFEPVDTFKDIRVGELTEVFFVAKNRSRQPVTAHAVPSIAPAKANPHFGKLECFCFEQQTLSPGEEREMPVRFFLNPELPDDVKVLTLSYQFYPSPDSGRTASN